MLVDLERFGGIMAAKKKVCKRAIKKAAKTGKVSKTTAKRAVKQIMARKKNAAKHRF